MDRSSPSLSIPKVIDKLQKKYPSVELSYEELDIDFICPELAMVVIKVENTIGKNS